MTVSPNRRLLALAERGERPTVTVYDLTTLKKRKVLSQTEAGTKASAQSLHLEGRTDSSSCCCSSMIAASRSCDGLILAMSSYTHESIAASELRDKYHRCYAFNHAA